MQRRVFEDNRDLNRSFGHPTPTTFSEHLANELTRQVFKDCRFGIDLHDAGGSAALVPHCRIHSCDPDECENCSTWFGRLLGTRIIVQREGHPNMLANHLRNEHGVPVVTIELGGGQRVFDDFQNEIVKGVANVLRAAGMLAGEVQIPGRQFYLHERFGVRVQQPCEIRFSTNLGDEVHLGDRLGEIYYPLEHRVEPIESPMCGFVFSLWQLNQAPAGQRIYSILEHDDCHSERTTKELFTELKPVEVHRIRM